MKDIEAYGAIVIGSFQITVDPESTEINMIDSGGNLVEGGTFSTEAFWEAITAFYDGNF